MNTRMPLRFGLLLVAGISAGCEFPGRRIASLTPSSPASTAATSEAAAGAKSAQSAKKAEPELPKKRSRGSLITQTWKDIPSRRASESVRLTYDRRSADCVEESRPPFNGPTLTRSFTPDHCRAFRIAEAVAGVVAEGRCDSRTRGGDRLGADCLCTHESRRKIGTRKMVTDIYELDYRACVELFPKELQAKVESIAKQFGYDF